MSISNCGFRIANWIKMNSDELKFRSRDFGLKIIAFIEGFPSTKAADVISRQLLRSAVSVGANYRSACRAKSRNDFICKINIAEEEADESAYWLEMIMGSQLASADEVFPLLKEASELAAIFTASGKTAKHNRIGIAEKTPQSAIRNPQ